MTELVDGRWPVEYCESRRCNAPIVWAITAASGSRMPVDVEPTSDGSIQLSPRHGTEPLAKVLGVAARFGKSDLRTSHFATCPDAARFRRRRA